MEDKEFSAIARIDERTKDIVTSLSEMRCKVDKMEGCIHRVNNDKPSWGTCKWVLGLVFTVILGAYSYSFTIHKDVNCLSDRVIVLEQKHK